MKRRRRTARSPSSPSSSIEAWLNRHFVAVLLALVAASVAVRGGYFLQLNAGPGIELHRWDQTDMYYYDAWGRQIAHGDWLSASVTVPMHDWHRRVAERYFTDHPEMRSTLTQEASQGGPAKDADTLLWTHWMGSRQFYQDPLYPYLIGLTYRIFGDDVRFVFAWQMALGVMSNGLICLLAWRFFGSVVAVCAGALALLCAPLVYYELVLLRESTIAFAGLGVIWLTDRALTRGGWGWFALLGASLGLAFLLKSSLTLLAVGVLIGIVAHFRRRWSELRVPALATVAGLVLALTPLAARNGALGLPPLAFASSGGFTFMISNDVTYDPKVGFHIDVPRFAQFMNETGGGLVSGVTNVLRAHTVASYVTLLAQKFERAWHWFEIPNNDNFYYTRLRAPVLAWLPVTFWLCSPLALVGLALSARRFSRVWLLYVLAACCLAPLIAFYVLGRFRIALVAAVIPFAALTIVEIVRATGNRQYLRAILVTAAVLILGTWTGRPLQGQPLIGATYWLTPFITRYEPALRAALAARDPARAASAYLQFFQYEPDVTQVTSLSDGAVVQILAQMHTDCASLLRASGQIDQAKVQSAQAAELARLSMRMDPSNFTGRRLLADTLFDEQSFGEAVASYTDYLKARPNDVEAMVRLAVALAATNRLDEAVGHAQQAVKLGPGNGEARWYLATLLLARGDVAGATEHAVEALALKPDDPAAHDLMGRVWASQGKVDAAKAEFERALQIDPAYVQAREHLKSVTEARSRSGQG